MLIILCMPLRDPLLPKDDISSAFAPPTFDLRSPEDKLTLWQFLTVTWMTPLISVGSKRQLNDEDVWFLGYEFQHSHLHERFRELQGSVVRRLIEANGVDLILLTIFGIVDLVASRLTLAIIHIIPTSNISISSLGPRSLTAASQVDGKSSRTQKRFYSICNFDIGRKACFESAWGVESLVWETLLRKIEG